MDSLFTFGHAWPLFTLAVSGVAALYISFLFLRRARLMEDTATSKVRSAHQGYIELEGVAQPDGEPDISPLTRTPCVWWSYQVRTNKKNSKTIDRKSSDRPFYLEDDTGRCKVLPAGAKVTPSEGRAWWGDTPWPSGPPPRPGSPGRGRYCYIEQLIRPDTPVYAIGLFRTRGVALEPAEENAALAEKLAEWKLDAGRMKLLDVNRDGKIDPREWEAARIVARKELRREQARPAGEGVHTLSRPAQPDRPFLVSTVLQKDLCRRWRGIAVSLFVYFAGAGALFAWQVVEYFAMRAAMTGT